MMTLTMQDNERGKMMDKPQKEIRKALREEKEITCLDLPSYITTLNEATKMPFGTVKAKIKRGF